jgi:hypothetical protein
VVKVLQLLEGHRALKPPRREASHGSEELAGRSVPTAIEFQSSPDQPNFVHHQRIDATHARQPIEVPFDVAPVVQGAPPGKGHEEMVIIGGPHPVFDRRFNVTVDTVLDRPGADRCRRTDEDRRQPKGQ